MDQELVKEYVIRAKNNDQEAIRKLYDCTSNAAYFAAKKFVKQEQDAMDIVQDAYVSAFSKLSQLTDESKFSQWLNRIVSNKAKDYLKKKKPLLFSDAGDDSQDVESFIEDESLDFRPKDNYDYQELQLSMSKIIDELSDENRMCIIMYYFQQLSVTEISEVLELSPNTIKSRLNYGRKQIKKEMDMQEGKGIFIRGIAPIPFMLWTFAELSQSIQVPTEVGVATMSAIEQLATMLAVTPVVSQVGSIKDTVVKIAAGLSLLTATTVGGVIVVKNLPENSEGIAAPKIVNTTIEDLKRITDNMVFERKTIKLDQSKGYVDTNEVHRINYHPEQMKFVGEEAQMEDRIFDGVIKSVSININSDDARRIESEINNNVQTMINEIVINNEGFVTYAMEQKVEAFESEKYVAIVLSTQQFTWRAGLPPVIRTPYSFDKETGRFVDQDELLQKSGFTKETVLNQAVEKIREIDTLCDDVEEAVENRLNCFENPTTQNSDYTMQYTPFYINENNELIGYFQKRYAVTNLYRPITLN